MLAYVILVVGFVLLVKGADFFVEGSAAVAKKFRIPSFIIGMTIVAMGTSAPECAVSIAASLKGSNGMAISNVVGSNIFNLMVVCGMCAMLYPLPIKAKTLKREFPFSILAAAVLGIMSFGGMAVGHLDGVLLMAIFIFFLFWMVRSAQMSRKSGQAEDEEGEVRDLPVWKCVVFIGGGLVAIVLGGQMVVDSAQTIALRFGLSENLVGLTICSIGTSLPELVTSIVAARKKQTGLALGNVIGSNIFNILLVGGIASALSPIAVTMDNLIDILLLIGMSLYVMLIVWKRQQLSRAGGVSLVAIYAAYMVYICIR